MKVFRASAYRRMPWKNGGGETAEIAVSPAGADFAAMDWRLSMATVAADGPFSSFPGIDRTLCVLSGVLRLEVAGQLSELTEASAPFPFPGEATAHGFVLRGPVTDLNVMTRRERLAHEVRRISIAGDAHIDVPSGLVLIFCEAGSVELPGGETLQALDTAVGEREHGVLTLRSAESAKVCLISVVPRPDYDRREAHDRTK